MSLFRVFVMNTVEIALILIGIICVVISLVFETDKKTAEEEMSLTKDQVDEINKKVTQLIDEQLSDLDEKTEITIEKISNKKIMEFTEYTDTVLAQVNRNHEESMFLYDMLNEKTKVVRRTIDEYETAKADKLVHTENEKTEDSKKVEITEKQVENISKAETSKSKGAKRGRKPSKPKVALTSNNNERILVLHKEGKTNLEIAKILGLGIGEVKLVVDLFTSDGE